MEDFRFYRRRLPQARVTGVVYFATWRIRQTASDLTEDERDRTVASLRHFDGNRYTLHAFVVRDVTEYEQKRDYILANPFKRWPEIESYRWWWALGME